MIEDFAHDHRRLAHLALEVQRLARVHERVEGFARDALAEDQSKCAFASARIAARIGETARESEHDRQPRGEGRKIDPIEIQDPHERYHLRERRGRDHDF